MTLKISAERMDILIELKQLEIYIEKKYDGVLYNTTQKSVTCG